MPSASSSRRSSSAASKMPSASAARASAAERAPATMYPSCSSTACIVTATLSSSSTTSTRAGGASAIDRLRDGDPIGGQGDREGGAAAGPAHHLELAAVLPHDAQAHPEAEAGALRFALGGEERLEDMAQVLLGD